MPAAAMVTGLPNATVNRIPRMNEKPRQIWTSTISMTVRSRGVHVRFIAMLKLLFKFYRQ